MSKAFEIKVGGKVLDYRLGRELDLEEVRSFFSQKYQVLKLWQSGRHVLGVLKRKNQKYFLKLATTEGISEVTKNEANWNEAFNEKVDNPLFRVPKNVEIGFFGELFYLITEQFEGRLLANRPSSDTDTHLLEEKIGQVIDFGLFIEKLKFSKLGVGGEVEEGGFREWFVRKTRSWFEAVPEDIRHKYEVSQLMEYVESSTKFLEKTVRHGDFTPWHIFALKDGGLGLIDGEHAKSDSVKGYDLGYLVQRVYSVLKKTDLADKILGIFEKRGYDLEALQVVMAARAIGGFLDESLVSDPDYSQHERFKNYLKR